MSSSLPSSSSSSILLYYQTTAVSVAIWWILLTISKQQPLYKVLETSTITIPSCLNWGPFKSLLIYLQQSTILRPFIFNLQTIGLAIAATTFGHKHLQARIVCAITYTLYHLLESSQTNRHGEYPVLYTMWVMAIPDVVIPEEYRHACIWGIAINFILLSGYAKIVISRRLSSKYTEGGGGGGWTHPSTLETYLTCYRLARSSNLDRPILPSWNKVVSNSKFLSGSIATIVLLLECLFVPASLWMDGPSRPYACFALIIMHVGIAILMSFKVGLAFFTTVPVYIYAFNCNAEIGSEAWFVAATVGLGPTLYSAIFSTLLPENWPCTAVSLFMFDGKTAQILLQLLMTEDTRMVLATTKVATNGVVGLKVLHHGEVVGPLLNNNNRLGKGEEEEGDHHVVHDCVLKTIGFTMLHGDMEPILEALASIRYDPKVTSQATRTFVHRTWASLTVENRLVEAHTGEDLSHVFFVRIDKDRRVSDVLM